MGTLTSAVALACLLVLFFMQPCKSAERESRNSTHQRSGEKIRIRRSDLKKDEIQQCLLMYHNDGEDREPTFIPAKKSQECESKTANCYRGICKRRKCVCCPPITQEFADESNNEKVKIEEGGVEQDIQIYIQPPYGQWQGEFCDTFGPVRTGDDDDDVSFDELEQDIILDPLEWKKLVLQTDNNAIMRPLPSKEDEKNRPKKCVDRTPSCWRGLCNDDEICECFKYEDVPELPGIYVGEYCDFFVEDSYYQLGHQRVLTCSLDDRSTCVHGFCISLDPDYLHSKFCYCGRGYKGPRCDVKVKKCPPCLNKSKCKSKRTLLGKIKFCECRKGWAGYACERPQVCLQPGTLKDLCITGTCRKKSKLQYCDCPSSKKLKTSGPYCKPHNYSPDKYGATAKCNGKWICQNGFCKSSRCQCNDGYVSKSDKEELQCDITCTENNKDEQMWGPGCKNPCAHQNCLNNECLYDTGECAKYRPNGDKVFTGCNAGFRRINDEEFTCIPGEPLAKGLALQDVPIQETYNGDYQPEFEDPSSHIYAEIKKTHQDFFRSLNTGSGVESAENELYGMTITPGSVVLDYTARFTTAEDSEIDLQELVATAIKEEGEDFDGGLGEEYKLDVQKTIVGKPRLLSSGENESDNKASIGYGLVGVTFFFIMICVFVVVKTKMDLKSKHKDKEDKKDSKKGPSKKSVSKSSRASSKKSQMIKSKKSAKSASSSHA